MEAYQMEQLPKVMEEIREDTTTEGQDFMCGHVAWPEPLWVRNWNGTMAGAVLYLERSDGVAVGLLKVKSLLVSSSILGVRASSLWTRTFSFNEIDSHILTEGLFKENFKQRERN